MVMNFLITSVSINYSRPCNMELLSTLH